MIVIFIFLVFYLAFIYSLLLYKIKTYISILSYSYNLHQNKFNLLKFKTDKVDNVGICI